MGASISSAENSGSLIEFRGPVTASFERSVMLEWLETNGVGDFASGTVAGPLTRREHGLFTVGQGPGGKPMVLLAQLDEALVRGTESIPLSCHRFTGVTAPEGYKSCAHFSPYPFPQWRYESGGIVLTRTIFLPRGNRHIVVIWRLLSAPEGECRLRVRPLFAYRDSDALTRANDVVNMNARQQDNTISISPYPGCPEFHLRHSGAQFNGQSCWYYRFQHDVDAANGCDSQEDLFSPGEFEFRLGQSAWLTAGVDLGPDDAFAVEAAERERRTSLKLFDMGGDPIGRILAKAAEVFPAEPSRLIAAYPDHSDSLRWGLIAFPGILLCTRRLPEAKSFLREAATRVEAAAAPGDEALWYIRAAEQHIDHARDWEFLRDELAQRCDGLMRRYLDPSNGGFHVAPDGLLVSENAAPLTWMDACVDDWAIAPRVGKPVEVNALWRHALALMVRWAGRRGDDDAARRYASLAELCARSFRNRFWNEEQSCLYDVVDGPSGGADSSIRPNQIIALALPGDLLDRRQASGILSIVEKRLLTPKGLRTLSIESSGFIPRIEGSPQERAAGLVNGAAYPWLFGSYADAVFRVHGRTSRACARIEAVLESFLQEHLKEACLGQVSECFNAVSPHLPRGSFAHAAAIGEIVRAYLEVKGRI